MTECEKRMKDCKGEKQETKDEWPKLPGGLAIVADGANHGELGGSCLARDVMASGRIEERIYSRGIYRLSLRCHRDR